MKEDEMKEVKITTTQLTQEQALHAIADGGQVLMIWNHNGITEAFNLNEKVLSCMTLGRGYLLIEESEEDENGEKIAESQQNPAENCKNVTDPLAEKLAEMLEEDLNDMVTDPEIEKNGPITVEIPNSHKEEKARRSKIDDERIIALRKAGMSEFKIAIEMESAQPTIHKHIEKLKKEGRL